MNKTGEKLIERMLTLIQEHDIKFHNVRSLLTEEAYSNLHKHEGLEFASYIDANSFVNGTVLHLDKAAMAKIEEARKLFPGYFKESM